MQKAESRMAPGIITRDGLLGQDTRQLAEIIEEDENEVNRLRLTHRRIARRMEYFTKEGRKGLGTPVTVEEIYTVKVEEWRGLLPCPWDDGHAARKGIVEVTNEELGETLTWTPLNIHMIREHGFYQGKGSTYRIEPEDAKRILGL
jgi:hypothetical protein